MGYIGKAPLYGKIELSDDYKTNSSELGASTRAVKSAMDDVVQNLPEGSIPEPATTLPMDNGDAAIGTSTDYARADHVHSQTAYYIKEPTVDVDSSITVGDSSITVEGSLTEGIGGYIDYFLVSIPEINIINKRYYAENNVATITFTIPEDTPVGTILHLTITPVDDKGNKGTSIYRTLVVRDKFIRTPKIEYPIYGATVGKTFSVISSTFYAVGADDTHVASQYRIVYDGEVVFDSEEISSAVTDYSFTLGEEYVRRAIQVEVRYKGETIGWSDWGSILLTLTDNIFATKKHIFLTGNSIITAVDEVAEILTEVNQVQPNTAEIPKDVMVYYPQNIQFGGAGYTFERKEDIAFIGYYFNENTIFVVKTNNFRDFTELTRIESVSEVIAHARYDNLLCIAYKEFSGDTETAKVFRYDVVKKSSNTYNTGVSGTVYTSQTSSVEVIIHGHSMNHFFLMSISKRYDFSKKTDYYTSFNRVYVYNFKENKCLLEADSSKLGATPDGYIKITTETEESTNKYLYYILNSLGVRYSYTSDFSDYRGVYIVVKNPTINVEDMELQIVTFKKYREPIVYRNFGGIFVDTNGRYTTTYGGEVKSLGITPRCYDYARGCIIGTIGNIDGLYECTIEDGEPKVVKVTNKIYNYISESISYGTCGDISIYLYSDHSKTFIYNRSDDTLNIIGEKSVSIYAKNDVITAFNSTNDVRVSFSGSVNSIFKYNGELYGVCGKHVFKVLETGECVPISAIDPLISMLQLVVFRGVITNGLRWSTDMVTWNDTNIRNVYGNRTVNGCIVLGNKMFVSIENKLYTSTDGKDFYPSNINPNISYSGSAFISYNGSMFYAYDKITSKAVSSEDGIIWSPIGTISSTITSSSNLFEHNGKMILFNSSSGDNTYAIAEYSTFGETPYYYKNGSTFGLGTFSTQKFYPLRIKAIEGDVVYGITTYGDLLKRENNEWSFVSTSQMNNINCVIDEGF